MKQTAVEWLIDKYIIVGGITPAMVEQAKQMEKEQIIDAYDRGYNEYDIYRNGQNYYKETYEQDKQR